VDRPNTTFRMCVCVCGWVRMSQRERGGKHSVCTRTVQGAVPRYPTPGTYLKRRVWRWIVASHSGGQRQVSALSKRARSVSVAHSTRCVAAVRYEKNVMFPMTRSRITRHDALGDTERNGPFRQQADYDCTEWRQHRLSTSYVNRASEKKAKTSTSRITSKSHTVRTSKSTAD